MVFAAGFAPQLPAHAGSDRPVPGEGSRNGELVTLSTACELHRPDPIEKKPLYHFARGAPFIQGAAAIPLPILPELAYFPEGGKGSDPESGVGGRASPRVPAGAVYRCSLYLQ